MKKHSKLKKFKFSLIFFLVVIPIVFLGEINFVSATCQDNNPVPANGICFNNLVANGTNCCGDLNKLPSTLYTCQADGSFNNPADCPYYDCSVNNVCTATSTLLYYDPPNQRMKCESLNPPSGACTGPADCASVRTSNDCILAKQCTTANCPATGPTSKCHMSNAGSWQWDRTPPGETACSDGYDNDCDTLIDSADPECTGNPSAPKLKFSQGATTNYAGVIGSNGVFDIKGVLSQSQSSITSSTADFVIRNNAGVIVALLDYNGNLKLKGTSSTRTQAQLNAYLTDGQTQFVVKTSSGSVVAVIDLNGNLYLLGGLRQSQVNPQ